MSCSAKRIQRRMFNCLRTVNKLLIYMHSEVMSWRHWEPSSGSPEEITPWFRSYPKSRWPWNRCLQIEWKSCLPSNSLVLCMTFLYVWLYPCRYSKWLNFKQNVRCTQRTTAVLICWPICGTLPRLLINRGCFDSFSRMPVLFATSVVTFISASAVIKAILSSFWLIHVETTSSVCKKAVYKLTL